MSDWSFDSQIPAGAQPLPELALPAIVQGSRGAFRVVALLGSGGGGRVYRALDPYDRPVALKLLRNPGSASQLERFRREGRMAQAIQHPNVVAVYETGSHEGQPFLVYELVEGGQTFAEALQHRDLEVRLDLLSQVIDGMAAAHREGVIHRDLKSENILLGADGRPRVTDFGLAKAEQHDRLTQTGMLVGTPRVMAPEQVRGEPDQHGPATDVWSLGVLLYEALAGEPPFRADTLAELAIQIGEATPKPPRQLDASVPVAVERVCLRALAKRAEDRYPNAEALGRALLAARRSAPARRVGWFALAGLGGLVALSLGVGAAFAVRGWPTPEPSAVPSPAASPEPDPELEGLAELNRAYDAKQFERSLELVKVLRARYPESLEVRLNEGEILCQLERWAEAVPAFDRALRLDPKNLRALTARGAAKGKLGQIEAGFADLNRALALDPNYADALEKRSLIRYENHEYRAALDDAERALALAPESSEALNFRGLARGGLGDLKGALRDFEAAYAKSQDPRTLANIGTVRIDLGQLDRGIADLRRVLAALPRHGPTWTSLGAALIRKGRPQEALEALDRALSHGETAWARFGRGVALKNLKRYAEAKAEFEWLVREHPRHPQVPMARQELRRLERQGR